MSVEDEWRDVSAKRARRAGGRLQESTSNASPTADSSRRERANSFAVLGTLCDSGDSDGVHNNNSIMTIDDDDYNNNNNLINLVDKRYCDRATSPCNFDDETNDNVLTGNQSPIPPPRRVAGDGASRGPGGRQSSRLRGGRRAAPVTSNNNANQRGGNSRGGWVRHNRANRGGRGGASAHSRPREASEASQPQRAGREREGDGMSRATREHLKSEHSRLVGEASEVSSVESLEDVARQVQQYLQCFCTSESGGGGGNGPRGGPRRQDNVGEGDQRVDNDNSQSQPNNSQARNINPRISVRDATRIQKLFRKNRKRAVREVLQENSAKCEIPVDRVKDYFTQLYSPRADNGGGLPDDFSFAEPPLDESNNILTSDFNQREVLRRLKKMSKSAPGPDGVTYDNLKKADSKAELISSLFSAVYRLHTIPSCWKESTTVLIYKKGDKDDLSNWRPIALGDTLPKLFSACLADRITHWAMLNKRVSDCQKGFLPYEGCFEHNFVLREAIDKATQDKRDISVAWLDLTNAFGSIPHAILFAALERCGAPVQLINIIKSMYTDCATRVKVAEGTTERIPMGAGVRQGCPASPMIFNLALEPIIRAIIGTGVSFEFYGQQVTVLAYADDLTIIVESIEQMQLALQTAVTTASSIGLSFNPKKCSTLTIKKGKVIPATFQLQGENITALKKGEHYQHLGVPTGVEVRQTPYETVEQMFSDIRLIDNSLLTPWQKCEVVASFILPRVDFILRAGTVQKTILNSLDKFVKRIAKGWLNLPQRASAEPIFIPPSRGGCGLFPVGELCDILTISHAFRMLTAEDARVRGIAEASLIDTVFAKLGREPTNEEIAQFLSGSTEGELGNGRYKRATFWTGARTATRRASGNTGVKWYWDAANEFLGIECRVRKERTIKIEPRMRGQIIRRLRGAVNDFYINRLLDKKDQGKVYDVTSRSRVSNHFMRSGSFTRFADWRFIHRARLDVVPLNGNRRWDGDGDKRCRVCGGPLETLPHVLNHCGHHSDLRQKRHDAVLSRLARGTRVAGEKKLNCRVAGLTGDLAGLKPDLVITDEANKSVTIVDVAIPFENKMEAFTATRVLKCDKYRPIAEALEAKGYKVTVDAFIVGALGGWDGANENVLKTLNVSPFYARMMRRLMISETIAWSRNIYVQHVSGVPQPEVRQSYQARTGAATHQH